VTSRPEATSVGLTQAFMGVGSERGSERGSLLEEDFLSEQMDNTTNPATAQPLLARMKEIVPGCDLQDNHRRYFEIAGIHVRVESELDFNSVKFKEELAAFAVDGPGDDTVTLRHYFELPDWEARDLGTLLYCKAPWAISRKDGMWFYRAISPSGRRLAVFSADYRQATIYSTPRDVEQIRADGWCSLALFPTDQVWLVPLLADRHAVMLHSAAVILNQQGLLFVGHSSAGKSTTVKMLKKQAEILCDDRNIARRWDAGWRVHGTWSHGEIADVSSASAPLRAILFLQQDSCNKIVRLTDPKEIWRRLLPTIIKALATAEWWQKELSVIESIVNEVPCYAMHFDKSGAIVTELEKLTKNKDQRVITSGSSSILNPSVVIP